MMEHECGVCVLRTTEHEGRCDDPLCEPENIWHLPPLCCPGCMCLSYEEAHLQLRKVFAGHYEVLVSAEKIGEVRGWQKTWWWIVGPTGSRVFFESRKRAVNDLLVAHVRRMNLADHT